MPHNWWTRKNLVLAAAVVALAFIGFVVIGVSYPEPAASAALGPDGSAAGWPSSSRPAAGSGTASPCPSASPKSRCADGCGRNRIGPETDWLEPEHPHAKTAVSCGGRVGGGSRIAAGRRRAGAGRAERRNRACGHVHCRAGEAPENTAPENKALKTAPEKEKAAPKKKKPAKMTRQQEIDRSVDRGTVPARYRNSVPKEYHQYIPFDKR